MKIKVTLAIVAVVFLLVANGYWSYLAGLAASDRTSAIPYFTLLQKQRECIQASDSKCVRITNELMLEITKVHIVTIKESNMAGSLTKEFDNFLDWHKTISIEHEMNSTIR